MGVGMGTSYDAIVIGGGIIGCSVAWRIAQSKRRVALVERGRVGGEASSAAGGILIPEAYPGQSPNLLQLWLTSNQLYPSFVDEVREATGEAFEFNVTGRIVAGFTDEDLAGLRAHLEHQGPAGIRAEWLDQAETRAAEPSISPEVLASVYYPDHGLVDNPRLTHALGTAVRRTGADLFESRMVTGFQLEGDRITGVETLTGALSSPIVINCAGSWAGLTDARVRKPVRPAKGQAFAVDRGAMPLRHIVQGPRGSAVPRADGRTILGATVDDVGFDKDVQAKSIANLFRGATRVLPGLEDARFLDAWAGLRPFCPDYLPIIGPDAGIRGLYWATGHYTMGILSAPSTSRAIADLIDTGKTSLPIEEFSAARFAAEPVPV
jgi:glycine oxidase